MGLFALCETLEVRHELLPLKRQSREGLGLRHAHEPGLVAERAFVIHTAAD
jgi:hypothetical protein